MKYFEIAAPIILDVAGKHSQRYLQARLTNDIRQISKDTGISAAALTPQGKTEGLFLLYLQSEGNYRLICDAGNKNEVLSALKRYLVADQVKFTDQSDNYSYLHILASAEEYRKIWPNYGFTNAA